MAEYIEREAALSAQNKSMNLAEMRERLERIHAADVRPVARGKWIDRDDDYYGWNMWACSACGEEFVLTEGTPDMNDYHFCPNCGAMMEGKMIPWIYADLDTIIDSYSAPPKEE